jgi:hypothetical protein
LEIREFLVVYIKGRKQRYFEEASEVKLGEGGAVVNDIHKCSRELLWWLWITHMVYVNNNAAPVGQYSLRPLPARLPPPPFSI